jgi:hypothetical protein
VLPKNTDENQSDPSAQRRATLSNLENENEARRSGKEPHPSRVLFIGSNKRLNDYYATRD